MGPAISILGSTLGKPRRPMDPHEAFLVATDPTKEKLLLELQKTMGIDPRHLNIGVAGRSGVGKSVLINAFLHTNVATAGIIASATQNFQRYDIPDVPHVKIWEIPGGGMESQPAETYFRDRRLYAFDIVCILYSGRLDEVALKVAKGCLKYGTPFVFLRTKSGDMVRAHRRLNRDVVDEKAAIKDAREIVSQHFSNEEAFGPFQHVRHFFVDAHDMLDGVGPRFEEQAWLKWMRDACERRRLKSPSEQPRAEEDVDAPATDSRSEPSTNEHSNATGNPMEANESVLCA